METLIRVYDRDEGKPLLSIGGNTPVPVPGDSIYIPQLMPKWRVVQARSFYFNDNEGLAEIKIRVGIVEEESS